MCEVLHVSLISFTVVLCTLMCKFFYFFKFVWMEASDPSDLLNNIINIYILTQSLTKIKATQPCFSFTAQGHLSVCQSGGRRIGALTSLMVD